MSLPNEVLQIILEYVAEVQHCNDPWLWRVRLVGCQFYDLANNLIWKNLKVAADLARSTLPPSDDAETDIATAVERFISHGMYARKQDDDELPLGMEDLVMSINPKLSFEIIHNAWTAYTLRDPVFHPLFHSPASEIDKSLLVKLSRSLCSEFRGYVSFLSGSHYSTAITENRVKDKATFDILKRHAHRVRTVQFDDPPHHIDFYQSASVAIAEHCTNLNRIELLALDANVSTLISAFVHLKISSISIEVWSFVPTMSFWTDNEIGLYPCLVSAVKQFSKPPDVQLSLECDCAIGSGLLKPVLNNSLKVKRVSIIAPREKTPRLALPPTTEDFVLWYNDTAVNDLFTITGPGVTAFTLWGGDEDVSHGFELTILHLEFPMLASLKLNGTRCDRIDKLALGANYQFSKLKHVSFDQCSISHIAGLIAYFARLESVKFGKEFLSFAQRADCRDSLRKIIAAVPAVVTFDYLEGMAGFVQIFQSYDQVKEIYVASDDEGAFWEDDEVAKWLEIWPGDRYKPNCLFKVRKNEFTSVDLESVMGSVRKYQETLSM